MSGRRPLAGVLVLAVAIGAAVLAWDFRVSFPTDPIGPRAFPLISVALLSLGAFSLWRTDGPPIVWPAGAGARRIVLAAASFVLYALLLAPAGFVPATTAEFTALAMLFGAPPVRGTATGLALTLVLYALFVWGLGLPLPVGLLFS